jgi:hypothetical protein
MMGNSTERCLPKAPEQDLIVKLRKWTTLFALALALLTACGGDNPGGDSGPDGGNTETTSSYN